MLESVTDPLNRTTTMEYDPVGRVTQQTLADGRMIEYDYDANGNLVALAPPGKPAHFFDHTPVNLTSLYLPPELADSTGTTTYDYNLDRQLVKTMFSDSSMIQVVYDTTGCGCGGGACHDYFRPRHHCFQIFPNNSQPLRNHLHEYYSIKSILKRHH